jgi:hypothetical protein
VFPPINNEKSVNSDDGGSIRISDGNVCDQSDGASSIYDGYDDDNEGNNDIGDENDNDQEDEGDVQNDSDDTHLIELPKPPPK